MQSLEAAASLVVLLPLEGVVVVMLATFKNISGNMEQLYQRIGKEVEGPKRVVKVTISDNVITDHRQKTKGEGVIQTIAEGSQNVARGKGIYKAIGKKQVVRPCCEGGFEPIRSMYSMVRAGPIIKNDLEGGMLL